MSMVEADADGAGELLREFNVEYKQAIDILLARTNLEEAAMESSLDAILTGKWTQIQAAAFLIAMQAKGVDQQELITAARYLLQRCVPVAVPAPETVLDTAGTGGDHQGTFNISTAAAFVVAACGVRVAKHGNRAQSGICGSSDLLAKLGVDLTMEPRALADCLATVGICFMFAPNHHPTLKQVAPVRAELGVRTMFNLLGPLINPAATGLRLAGVFDPAWVIPYALAFQSLGVVRAVVVHADGLDEFSVAAVSRYVLMDGNAAVKEFASTPEEAGVGRHSLEELRVSDLDTAVAMFNAAIDGTHDAVRDAVALNAGAALWAAGQADDLRDGTAQALGAISAGIVRAKVDDFLVACRT